MQNRDNSIELHRSQHHRTKMYDKANEQHSQFLKIRHKSNTFGNSFFKYNYRMECPTIKLFQATL